MSMRRNPVFDYDEALRRVDQDLETFHTLMELFVEHGPKELAAIKAAMDARDPAAVARSAHRLKGSVMQFCAPTVVEAAMELEKMGRAGDVSSGAPVYVELESRLFQLAAALRDELQKGFAA
ncbi:MAG: Hpt domain-containing protein [Nitrospira sp.]|nr:Hpt domain-containing protein [Nitrospira sp.]